MNDQLLSGSYSNNDVIFLLKELSGQIIEQNNEYREKAIQSGIHYSEMLPIEYTPTKEYMDIFYETLEHSKLKIAKLVATLSDILLAQRGSNMVLVSLARAGTPIGILIKRFIKYKYNIDLPHYSISIIRDKGIDENALLYILDKHACAGIDTGTGARAGTGIGTSPEIQFIDGWTGKGVIQDTLIDACNLFYEKYQVKLDSRLAVLSDPAYCTSLNATNEDFLIPSACLNSTVSGLMSRTVLNKTMISDKDFHGAKFYKELADSDVSNYYIDVISNEFKNIDNDNNEPIWGNNKILENVPSNNLSFISNPYKGLLDISKIKSIFNINDINLIKPGVGETTRVLLRRIPWKILIDSFDNKNLRHIIRLANERNVPVEVFNDMSYSCCGIIKPKEFGDL
jgi:hypothetical protein